MKYLKVIIDPIRIKGDLDDPDQLQTDLYEKLTAMIESEVLAFTIDEDEEDSEEDY